MRTLVEKSVEKVGQEVTLMGWVNSRRDHGGLIFIDLRDHTGVVQLVITPDDTEMFKLAEQLRDEFVVSATGNVTDRAEELKNPKIETGNIEVKVNKLSILNRAEALPIQINT